MPGHALEKRWGEVSDHSNRALGKLLETLSRGEELYQEMQTLYLILLTDDAVAAQLFQNDPADPAELTMTEDWKLALEGVHAMYIDPALAALRKVVTTVR